MKIVTLLENDRVRKDLKNAHGLSLYIEANDQKILFDLGPNNYYLKNAKKLGIDLSEVDILVISHGHFDHGKGLNKFLKTNKKATIYLSKTAFDKHFKYLKGLYIPIGIKKPKDLERIHYIDLDESISKGIKLYSNVEYVKQLINDNSLMREVDGAYLEDNFDHEIYLVVNEGTNKVLFSGCSHKGIGNIIKSIQDREKSKLTHVIGGFHLSNYDHEDVIQMVYMESLGTELLENNAQYFSCHCTGNDAFTDLKKQMGTKLDSIHTGSVTII
ncbi:MAG: MBL fold metallo-hydrolase [Firmicutes bacterium]|nr:MBL fold metallo-hydrolase [Bacillota bacterium]